MKKFIAGFSIALILVIIIFKLIERNHTQLLEIVKNLPNPIKVEGDNSLKNFFNSRKTKDSVA